MTRQKIQQKRAKRLRHRLVLTFRGDWRSDTDCFHLHAADQQGTDAIGAEILDNQLRGSPSSPSGGRAQPDQHTVKPWFQVKTNFRGRFRI